MACQTFPRYNTIFKLFKQLSENSKYQCHALNAVMTYQNYPCFHYFDEMIDPENSIGQGNSSNCSTVVRTVDFILFRGKK